METVWSVCAALVRASHRRPVTAAATAATALVWMVLPAVVAVIATGAILWAARGRWNWQAERLTRITYGKAWADAAENLRLTNRSGEAPSGHLTVNARGVREVNLKLPVGMTVDDVRSQSTALAAAHGAVRAVVRTGPPGWATVRYMDRDPLVHGAGTWPGIDSVNVPLTTPVPIGVDEDGEPTYVELWQSSLLIGGSPGSGKSGATQLVVAAAALDPTVDLVIIDAKRGTELGEWRGRAAKFAADSTEAVAALDDVMAKIESRYEAMAELGLRKVSYGDPRFRPLVLVVDELAEVTGTGTKESKAAGETLRRIVALGRAAGVTVVAATQKPDATVVPTGLRDLFAYRLGFRCGARGQAETIAAEVAGELVSIPANQPGTGFLLKDDGIFVRLRTFFLSDGEIAALARRLSSAHTR